MSLNYDACLTVQIIFSTSILKLVSDPSVEYFDMASPWHALGYLKLWKTVCVCVRACIRMYMLMCMLACACSVRVHGICVCVCDLSKPCTLYTVNVQLYTLLLYNHYKTHEHIEAVKFL